MASNVHPDFLWIKVGLDTLEKKQKDLASKLGMSESSFSRQLRNGRALKAAELAVIHKFFEDHHYPTPGVGGNVHPSLTASDKTSSKAVLGAPPGQEGALDPRDILLNELADAVKDIRGRLQQLERGDRAEPSRQRKPRKGP